MKNTELLQTLCGIPGTSGDESLVRDFLLDFTETNKENWKHKPEIWHGKGYRDNLALIFGKPRLALYAHMDTVGFTVRYDNHVVPVGGPAARTGDVLVFESEGRIQETRLIAEEDEGLNLLDFPRPLEPGTLLTYEPRFFIENQFVHSPYLDNRLGIWALLQLAAQAEDVALVFTTYEEHGGGAAGYLARLLYERYGVDQCLIADVTWSTEGVFPGSGPVVSLRDSRIPRRHFVNRIRQIASDAGIPFQLEVEMYGGSDGKEIQQIPYPVDWCFIGPPSRNPHSSLESVHVHDLEAFPELLAALCRGLNQPG